MIIPGVHGAPRPDALPCEPIEIEKAQHFAEEALRVAERLDDAARLVGGHMALVWCCTTGGSSSRRSRTFGGASRCSIRTCSSPDSPGSYPAVACQFFPMLIPGCSVTRIGPSMTSGQRQEVRDARAPAHPRPKTLLRRLVHTWAASDWRSPTMPTGSRIGEEYRIPVRHALALPRDGSGSQRLSRRRGGADRIGQGHVDQGVQHAPASQAA